MLNDRCFNALDQLARLAQAIQSVWVPSGEKEDRRQVSESIKGPKILLATIAGESLDDAFLNFYGFDHVTISYKVRAENANDEVGILAYQAVPYLEMIIEEYYQTWGLTLQTREEFCEFYYDNIYLKYGDLPHEIKSSYREMDEAFCASSSERKLFEQDLKNVFTNSRSPNATIDPSLDHDLALLDKLRSEIELPDDLRTHWLYFKRWTLGDDTTWYKIGITSDLDRRDSEQNILPVPSETIEVLSVSSKIKAREIEKNLHRALEAFNIKSAGNRELFTLEARQVQSIVMLFNELRSTDDF